MGRHRACRPRRADAGLAAIGGRSLGDAVPRRSSQPGYGPISPHDGSRLFPPDGPSRAAAGTRRAGRTGSCRPGRLRVRALSDAGVWRIAYAFGSEKGDAPGHAQAHTASIGWSPTAQWFTQLYTGWYGAPGHSAKPYGWSWLNHFQLDPGATGPLGLGLYIDLERPREHDDGYGLTWGPTIQFDSDQAQFNLNLLLEKYLHADTASAAALKYQWQAKWLWRPGIELGAQGFGELEPWRHWSPAGKQEHTLGPALFGKWPQGAGRSQHADAALLLGATSASPNTTLRMRVQYEF